MDTDTTADRPAIPVSADTTELARTLDAISLRQALLDFEVANARVLDLTARLVEANERAARFTRMADDAVAARVEADERAIAAETGVQAERIELGILRAQVEVLVAELDAHREVIAARDRDQVMLHGEIAARDQIISARTDELAAIRGTRTYRFAERLNSLVRIGRRGR